MGQLQEADVLRMRGTYKQFAHILNTEDVTSCYHPLALSRSHLRTYTSAQAWCSLLQSASLTEHNAKLQYSMSLTVPQTWFSRYIGFRGVCNDEAEISRLNTMFRPCVSEGKSAQLCTMCEQSVSEIAESAESKVAELCYNILIDTLWLPLWLVNPDILAL